jgi:hypothetical protein
VSLPYQLNGSFYVSEFVLIWETVARLLFYTLYIIAFCVFSVFGNKNEQKKMKRFNLVCKTIIRKLIQNGVSLSQYVSQYCYNCINRILPQHLQLSVLSQLNQFVGFIVMPFIYLFCKILSFCVCSFFAYLPLFFFVLIYTSLLLDYRIRLFILKMNTIFLNFWLTQLTLYYICCMEQIIVLSPITINCFFIIVCQLVFIYKIGGVVVSTLAYLTLWLLIFYAKVRRKYLNSKELKLTSVPTWCTLVEHWDHKLYDELNQFKYTLPGDNFNSVLFKQLKLRNSIGFHRNFPFAFLATRSVTSGPLHTETQKITQEVVEAVLKNAPESSRATLGIGFLCLLGGTYVYMENRKISVQEREIAVKEREVTVKEEQLRFEKEKNESFQSFFRKYLKENDERKNYRLLIEDKLGNFFTKRQLARLESFESKGNLNGILKDQPITTTTQSSNAVVGVPALPDRFSYLKQVMDSIDP